MKEVKTIGVIGMGAVGISVSCILQQANIRVLGYQHKSRSKRNFKKLLEEEKIIVSNKTNVSVLPKKNVLNIEITDSLDDLVSYSDIILRCCSFSEQKSIYDFTEYQKSILRERSIPLFLFPGSWVSLGTFSNDELNVGMIGYSPVFATSTLSSDGVFVEILDFKLNIPLAFYDVETKNDMLIFFNKLFSKNTNTLMFIDGGSPIKTVLSSPVTAINASAICDNALKLKASNGGTIYEEIYMLSDVYTNMFDKLYKEQVLIGEVMNCGGIFKLRDWFSNRISSLSKEGDLQLILSHVYKGKLVAISGKDRRLFETFYTLLFFKYFSNAIGIDVPATDLAVCEMNSLQKEINGSTFPESICNYVKASAISYANLMNPKIEKMACSMF
ncbi:hypothetical protein SAMN04489761_3279 [Tenacibaculum sp. MAR_2009_124]|uniref:hypothetical protein n=1 Tax=Tenacibaculum sp. MAR_2009_124 TaxID=1250059 RepID=UPI0008987843|nr:hypothetical protein [Tenacibaculum sp. MAR_2009_124]SEC54380.1 hypothetical protein SAMN04489761_3279 [Tenacibaculum sp. MAR_2009_124]